MRMIVRVFWLFLCISCLGTSVSQAGWIQDGVPLTTRWGGRHQECAIAKGPSGDIIVAYTACYSGAIRIAAQRIDASGTGQWGENGIMICKTMGDQWIPQLIPDGAGGAVITWQDSRSGNDDIYAQRVNASGKIQWAPDGVAVCTAMEGQWEPTIISDDAGGAIIAWIDSRDGKYDIYAQRVNASGEVQWAANGVAICAVPGNKFSPRITSDLAGGAIITWCDFTADADLYAQRVNALGEVQWATGGVAICTAEENQSASQIISDGAGGAIIVWSDGRGAGESQADIYAQRVNASGEVQWTTDGVAICTVPWNQWSPQIIPDGVGGAVITWEDNRSLSYWDIYVQRVNASGEVQWAADGIAVCTASRDQRYPVIASDGAAGAIIGWDDARSDVDHDVYAQRVNASGVVQWTPDGVVICAATGDQLSPRITDDGAGGAIAAWGNRHDWDWWDFYAQRVNASGAIQWATDGVVVCGRTGDQHSPQVVADGTGGAIVAWMDSRDGDYDIYAQRVNASGTVQWTTAGVSICTASGDQSVPQAISDGAGGAVITWQDNRSGNYDIYAQRVNALGEVQWATDGVAISTALGSQLSPQIISDLAGGAIIVWYGYGADADIYAQRVNASGTVQWTPDGVAVCTTSGDQSAPQIISDGAGGAIIVWQDHRSGAGDDIYAQRVIASGAVQWTADGIPLCAATENQDSPRIATSGAGGAIIAWRDNRSGNHDIYAQRVNASGVVQWTTNGIPLCAAVRDQDSPEIATDGTGGAIIAWRDYRSGVWYDIYAQRVNVSGTVQWVAGGVAIYAAMEGDRQSPQIISDGVGGAVIAWWDYREPGVYAQRVNALGADRWTSGGLAIGAAAGVMQPQLISDGTNGAILTWEDNRCHVSNVYAQRIRGSGEIVATLLQQWTARSSAGSISISWVLSEMDDDVRFSIMRSSASEWVFEELRGVSIEGEGTSFRFEDKRCLPGSSYKYRIDYEAPGVARKTLFETDLLSVASLQLTLNQNYPNPFNPSTRISYALPSKQLVKVAIYDVSGKRIRLLVNKEQDGGQYTLVWNGMDERGNSVASGVYFSRLTAGKETISRKMVILR